jgi:hypothetical protein
MNKFLDRNKIFRDNFLVSRGDKCSRSRSYGENIQRRMMEKVAVIAFEYLCRRIYV